ncbi:MAG TPA: response regulator [Bdellovibrionales bacterium]|nr:response regulator [Bdellovibrionales bacterium]
MTRLSGYVTRRWKNLSISKKLYAVVGVMALLIASELLVLRFAMSTLSAVRAFVGGEGSWSKAQKTAVLDLQKYAFTKNPLYYGRYEEALKVPAGDRRARLQLESRNPDLATIYQGFLDGKIHEHDIPGVMKLFARFHEFRHLREAIDVWRRGDRMLMELEREAEKLKAAVESRPYRPKAVVRHLDRIYEIDRQLTALEEQFSYVLGEGSRWMEDLLLKVLTLLVLTVEGTGILLTISFARNLTSGLQELNEAARKVGEGDFSQRVTPKSGDELGHLAGSLNQMAENLQRSVGERREAQNASEVKSLFLANMSHEIRTPLGSILGFAELLKDPGLTESERAKYLEIIERTGRTLARLINDILDISKIEAGHLEVEKSNFSLSELLTDIRNILSLRVAEKNIDLRFVAMGLPPERIHSDPIRLRQIVMNLLSNAVKFTERGSVTLEYGVEGPNLYFKVADTGPGIPANKVGELFRPFSQADASRSRRHEGTGLGLVLSRRLARALGGDVELVDNRPGSVVFKATVTLEAPQAAGAPKPRLVHPSGAAVLEGQNLLVVDDVPENQLLIRILLEKQGARVELASNGREGVDKALSGGFDAILMDMQMPVLDGYAAVRELRARGLRTPIVALTAHAMKEDRTRCLEAGCDAYITKPVERGELVAVLARFAAARTHGHGPATEIKSLS